MRGSLQQSSAPRTAPAVQHTPKLPLQRRKWHRDGVRVRAALDEYLILGAGGMVASTTLAQLHSRLQRAPGISQGHQPAQTTLTSVLAWAPLLNWAAWLQRSHSAWRGESSAHATACLAASAFYATAPALWVLHPTEDHGLVTACASSFLCLLNLQIHTGVSKSLNWSPGQLKLLTALPWQQPKQQTPEPATETPAISATTALQSPSPVAQESPTHTLQDVLAAEAQQAAAEEAHWDARYRLRTMTVAELRVLARERGLRGRSTLRKRDLVALLEQDMGYSPGPACDDLA